MTTINNQVDRLRSRQPFAAAPHLRKLRAQLLRAGIIMLLVGGVVLIIAGLPDHKTYFGGTVGYASTEDQASSSNPVKSFGQLPLTFELNQGQLKREVKFLSRGAGSEIYMMRDELVLRLPKREGKSSSSSNKGTSNDEVSSKFNHVIRRRPASASRDLVRMRLVNARAATPVGVDALTGSVNYFIGKDPRKWHTNIRTYRRVLYQGVYPGIDQSFYGNEQQLEYDFIVSPGANPRAIKLAFNGPDDVSIDSQGDLVLFERGSEQIRLRKPFAYQEINGRKREIAARYVVRAKREIGFEIGAYDAGKPLIIDPILSFSTYWGGTGNDAGFDIAVDVNGNTYVTGSTESSDFSSLGGSNAFVAKFNAAGTERTYLAILGGSSDDTGFGIAVDNAGSAYVTGVTGSLDFPVLNSGQLTFGGGSQDAFIAKLNPTGSAFSYATYLGGSGNDAGFGIAVDGAGSAYVAGSTDSTEFSTLGNTDAFVAKLSPTGSERSYLAVLGGSGDETGFDLAVDGEGSAYIVGSTDSNNFTTEHAMQPNFGGAQDAFVAKLNPSGSTLVYSTYLGGAGNDSGYAIAVDSLGSVYLTGATDSTEFSTLGGRDVFVAKFNSIGIERTYFTILGGNGDDAGFGIAVDSTGQAYITGSSDSSNFTTTNGLQANSGGSQDAFIAKLNSTGATLNYSTLMGRAGNESGFAIAVDNSGGAYVTGFTSSNDFPTLNPYQAVNGGSGDAFVMKITDGVIPATLQFNFVNYSVNERDGVATITVTRAGDLLGPAKIDYATSDGTAQQRTKYTTASGTLNFAAGQSSRTFTVLVTDDAIVQGNQTVNLTLSNPTGGTLGGPSTAVLTILDNDTVSATTNPVDDARFFVRQHYYDFLGRVPDQGGLDYWTERITQCGSNLTCINFWRSAVSAAFFIELEFQNTGSFVYRTYKASYGLRPTYAQFTPDRARVVDSPNPDQNKQNFALLFVQRPEFIAKYPLTLDGPSFVNALLQTILQFSQVNLTSQQSALITIYSNAGGGNSGRAAVLRAVADNQTFVQAEYNKAFVLMQYFGYLKRDPDEGGYQFWLNIVNNSVPNDPSGYRSMVCAFITSPEYQQRFSPVITRNDTVCAPQ